MGTNMKQEYKRVFIVFLIIIALSFLIRILFIEKHWEISDTINIFVAIGTIGATIGAFYAANIAIKNTDRNHKISEIKEYIHTLQRLEILLIEFKRSISKTDYRNSLIMCTKNISDFFNNHECILIRNKGIFNIINSFIINITICNDVTFSNRGLFKKVREKSILNSEKLTPLIIDFIDNFDKLNNKDLITFFDIENSNCYLSNKVHSNSLLNKNIKNFYKMSNGALFLQNMYYNSSLKYIKNIEKITESNYYNECVLFKKYIILYSFFLEKIDLQVFKNELENLDINPYIDEIKSKYNANYNNNITEEEILNVGQKVKEYFNSQLKKIKEEIDRRKKHEKKDI